MSRYFAEINNEGIVQRVIVADSLEWCVENLGGTWKETFMGRPDKNYAAKGVKYHTATDNFEHRKPYPSWVLSEKLEYEAPVKHPGNGKPYNWDDQNRKWVELAGGPTRNKIK